MKSENLLSSSISYELSKDKTKMTRGLAIISMVLLHLFCRKGADVYGTPLIWINSQVPLVYYLGFLSEIPLTLYCLCSGYAHYRLGETNGLTIKRNANRLLKFLLNFWIICILFSVVGLIFKNNTIPKNILTFFENFFLLKSSYNGAWWFAATYVYLVILSPLFFKVVKNSNSLILGIVLAVQYIIIWLLKRFDYTLSAQGYILSYLCTQINNLIGKPLFAYGIGMIFAKENLISLCGIWIDNNIKKYKSILFFSSLVISSLAMCIIHKAILMPFYAIYIFILFNLWEKKRFVQKVFLFLGEHSTNIWLTHMFFYLVLFSGLVIKAKYPILILGFMMVLCVAVSYIVQALYKPLLKILDRKNAGKT